MNVIRKLCSLLLALAILSCAAAWGQDAVITEIPPACHCENGVAVRRRSADRELAVSTRRSRVGNVDYVIFEWVDTRTNKPKGPTGLRVPYQAGPDYGPMSLLIAPGEELAAYVVERELSDEIYIANVDGTLVRRVAAIPREGGCRTGTSTLWFCSGATTLMYRQIVATGYRIGPEAVATCYQVDLPTGTVTQVTRREFSFAQQARVPVDVPDWVRVRSGKPGRTAVRNCSLSTLEGTYLGDYLEVLRVPTSRVVPILPTTFRLRIPSTRVTPIEGLPSGPFNLSSSPNGIVAAVRAFHDRADDISILDSATGTLRTLVSLPVPEGMWSVMETGASPIEWTEDGQFLVYGARYLSLDAARDRPVPERIVTYAIDVTTGRYWTVRDDVAMNPGASLDNQGRLQPGESWGADGGGALLRIEESGLTLFGSCALTRFGGPVFVSNEGTFCVKGQQFSTHGGAVDRESVPVVVYGRVIGNKMILTWAADRHGKTSGVATFTRGKRVTLYSCG